MHGILKERADVDKALQLHFACNNLRALYTEADRLATAVFPPLVGNAVPQEKYYRVLGLATPSGEKTSTVFSQWLDKLPDAQTAVLTEGVYRHYRTALNDFIVRAAAPFRTRAAAEPAVTPDDTGIGRCYHGLRTIDQLTGALQPSSAMTGWLLPVEEARNL